MEQSAMERSKKLQAYASGTLLVFFVYAVVYFLPAWLDIISKRLNQIPAIKRRRQSELKDVAVEDTGPAVTHELEFPSDWYTSEKLFQLEKRAIISKTWLHVCHSSIFSKPGDYRTYSIAGYSFFVILGKDRKLRAFHNVCRHRAYTVATKEAGSSLVLRCKYHGWSYDSQGKLIKAPKFEEVAGFDKAQNGLFKIRTFVDSSGFLYANFDVYGSDGLSIRVGVPIRARLSLVESWKADASINWKIAVHSGAFHVPALAKQSTLMGSIKSRLYAFVPWTWPAQIELSPLTHLLRSAEGDLWLTISVIPQSSTSSSVACSLYSFESADKARAPIGSIRAGIDASIAELELIFEASKQDGSIYDMTSQEPLLSEIKAHSRLERLMHGEVHPASRLRETSKACRVADDLCKELEAAAAGSTGDLSRNVTDLAW